MKTTEARLNKNGEIVLITNSEKGRGFINLSAVQRSINKNLRKKTKELEKENEKLKEEIDNIKNVLEKYNLRIKEGDY